jgi:hypothetical protein
MGKQLKTALIIVPLMGAGHFFGTICRRIGHAYGLLIAPSEDLLGLLLWFLLAVGALTVSAGLVAALVRPVWIGVAALALSGASMLVGWRVTVVSGILTVVYLLAGSVYLVEVAKELNERIRFSVRSFRAGRGALLLALVLAACGSLYISCAEHIEREGFSLPDLYIEAFVGQMEKRVVTEVPAEDRQQTVNEFREELRRTVDDFVEHRVKPYEEFIPLGVAAGTFMPLVTITNLLAWVPTAVLDLVFSLLTALGVTRVVCETQEVQRVVIE